MSSFLIFRHGEDGRCFVTLLHSLDFFRGVTRPAADGSCISSPARQTGQVTIWPRGNRKLIIVCVGSHSSGSQSPDEQSTLGEKNTEKNHQSQKPAGEKITSWTGTGARSSHQKPRNSNSGHWDQEAGEQDHQLGQGGVHPVAHLGFPPPETVRWRLGGHQQHVG